jgi:hypothetical protein
MMQYTHTKTISFINSILTSLGDSKGITYVYNEVLLAIHEGLRLIDCLSYFSRSIKTFAIPTQTSFIDLTTITELVPFIGFNKLISELEYELDRHLLEDSISTSTINHEVFDNTSYRVMIERKCIEFLLETGLLFTHESLELGSPPITYIQLAETILNVRRVAFFANNKYSTLTRESEDNVKSFTYNSNIAADFIPNYYSQTTSPKNLIRFYPRINDIGKLELLSIKRANFDNITILPIISNLSWGIKYGVLYEYYRQPGNGNDEKRAEYCKSRWQQAINIAKNYSLILEVRILDQLVSIDTLDSFDTFTPNWQNTIITKVDDLNLLSITVASWNIIALSSKLDASINATAEIDFLQNTILPISNDDFIQIPFEFIPILEVYASHYLQLKIGGARFFDGIEKLNSLLEGMVKENARLNVPGNELALIPYKTMIKQRIQKPIEADGYTEVTQQNG